MTSQEKFTYIHQFITNNINETSTNHVSNEVLEVIHLFLEEFIDLLMKSANSLDISHLKSITLELLSENLGKELLVEAEIELLHQQQESENATYSEAFYIQQFALKKSFEKYHVLQSTTAEEENQSSDDHSVEIPPVVVIYVTSIAEHMAEYILNLVFAGGDTEDIGIKEVFDVLLEDKQLIHLFQQMSLKEKLERRIGIPLTTPLPSPISLKKNQFIMRSLSVFSIATRTDDPDISFNTDDHRPHISSSIKSSESIQDRPLSAYTTTITTKSNKGRFHFFKEKRNSISLSFSKKSNPSSPVTPTNTDFDDLIRSGNTKKVSLTPNRLRSIEIKEDSHSEVTTISWEKFSMPIKGRRTKKTSRVPPPPPLPVPPLPHMNSPSPPLTPASSVSSYSYQKSKQDELNAGSDMLLLDMQTSSPPNSTMTNTSSIDTITTSPTSDAESNMTTKQQQQQQQQKYKNTTTAGPVNVLLPVIIKKSVSTTTEETDEEEDSLFSSNMIYALPEISQTYITNVSKEDKGCQTEPFFDSQKEEDRGWPVVVWNKHTSDKQLLLTNV